MTKRIMASLMLIGMLAVAPAQGAWLLVDEDGNTVHFPLSSQQNIQEGDSAYSDEGLFLGVWVWV